MHAHDSSSSLLRRLFQDLDEPPAGGGEVRVFSVDDADRAAPRINRDIVAILQSAAMRSWLLDQAAEPVPGTPQEFAAFIKSETLKWERVISTAGIKPE